MFNRPLNSFVPPVYDGFTEIEQLINAEENILDVARSEMFLTFFNTFVLTSDEEGVIMFERMLNITSDNSLEDLDLRKQRIINRLSMKSSYTFRFLKNRLDEIIGKGKWSAYIDFDNYILYVQSSASNQSWYQEVSFTINQIKPCNLIFINVPYIPTEVKVSEEVSYSTLSWMYRLGSWKLGQYPFCTMDEKGVIKMRSVPSVESHLLNDLANFVANDVSYVLINENVKIDEFELKQVNDATATIEYEVPSSVTNLITSIKLMRADDVVLTQCIVYVPVTDTVVCKHSVALKEGV